MRIEVLTLISIALGSVSSCVDRAEPALDCAMDFQVGSTKTVLADVSSMLYDGSTFEVSAAYTSGGIYNAGSAKHLMDRRPVRFNGSAWTYSPVEYWEPGRTYRFRAIWPSSAVSDLTDDLLEDGISFAYAVAADPASQVDLLMSDLQNVIVPSPVSVPMPLVKFIFRHLLSNVGLEVKVLDENDQFQLTGAWLGGMKDSGRYSNGSWDVSDGQPMKCSVLSGERLLMIPQSLVSEDILLSFDYIVTHKGVSSEKSCSVVLPAPVGGSWQSGKRYNYKLEMKEDYDHVVIDFDSVAVLDWVDDGSGDTYDFLP